MLGGMFAAEASRHRGLRPKPVQSCVTGLPTWGSGQPGQVGNQAALTVDPVLGSRLVNPLFFTQPSRSNCPGLPTYSALSAGFFLFQKV